MKALFLLKADVKLGGATPQLLRGLASALEIWSQLGIPELVVTSGNDGQHMHGSLHYKGCAADLRTHNIRDHGFDPDVVVAHLRAALGGDWDVVLEHVGDSNEHIHMEFDPKG